eukprot:139361_1
MIKKKKKKGKKKEIDWDDLFKEPEPIPKVPWIEDNSYWLNEVVSGDEVMIFDEKKSEWNTGKVTKVSNESRNSNIDISLQIFHFAENDENISIKFENTMHHKLRPKYTVKRTHKFITTLFKLHNIDTSEKEQNIASAIKTLATIDDVARERFIQELRIHLHKHEESKARFGDDTKYYFDGFSTTCIRAWYEWRERTQRNYPPPSPVVPQIEVSTRIPGYGFDVQQDTPKFIETSECNGNIVKYMFTNRQKIQNRMALICYHKDTCLQKQLITGIKLLQKNNLDYRYPTKDLIIASKQSDRGDWYCDACYVPNTYRQTTCEKCGKERNQNMDDIVSKIYDYGQIMKYNIDEYSKWKIRIQNLIDPLLNSEKFWIPSLFHIDDNSKVSIKSEIHNLPRVRYKKLYEIIGKIFENMISSFEWILGDIKLRNQDIQVIVGMQDYQLYAEQIYHGGLHREGYKEETIEGVGVYYFDKSEYIEDDIFRINTETRGVCGSRLGRYDQDIVIKNGSFIVFNNNNLNHKLKVLKNGSKMKFATRKILTFFLPEFIVKSVKKNINNHNDEIIYNNIIVNWIKLCDIQLFEMRLVNMIILYSFDIMKQIKTRDKLRETRLKPYRVSQTLAWIGRTN